MTKHQILQAGAYILAGGKSSRMGSDKGLVRYHDREMIGWVIEVLKTRFPAITIVTGNPLYEKFSLPLIPDAVTGKGPLAGIFTGLNHSAEEWNFFIACDMPHMTAEVIDSLWSEREGYHGVVPWFNDFPESMCAFYSRACLPIIEKRLANGQNKIQDMFAELNIRTVDFTNRFLSGNHPFRNFNTRHDLELPKQNGTEGN